MEWDLTSFVVRSHYRKKVLLELYKPQRPSQIAQSSDFRLTHVTRALRELKQKKLVICLNPNDTFGRFYELTQKGKNVVQNVRNLGKQ